jgi:predicted ribosome quality control (RQC) complex YloA/Tae2 family protein
LVQVFHDYNYWIEQRSQLIQQFESIQQSYEKQCEDIMNYVDMIDDLRTVVYKNIRKLSETSSSPSTTATANEYLPIPPPLSSSVHSHSYQLTEDDSCHQQQMSSGEDEIEIEIDEHQSNKTFMKKLRGTTKKTIQQAEEGFLKLDHVIRQLRTNIQKK